MAIVLIILRLKVISSRSFLASPGLLTLLSRCRHHHHRVVLVS